MHSKKEHRLTDGKITNRCFAKNRTFNYSLFDCQRNATLLELSPRPIHPNEAVCIAFSTSCNEMSSSTCSRTLSLLWLFCYQFHFALFQIVCRVVLRQLRTRRFHTGTIFRSRAADATGFSNILVRKRLLRGTGVCWGRSRTIQIRKWALASDCSQNLHTLLSDGGLEWGAKMRL